MSDYGNTPPALGVKFLSDSLTNSLSYSWGTGNNGFPQTDQHWINNMNSRWKSGQPITYGGDGYQSGTTTIPTSYMFTGDPVSRTGWSETNPGGGLSPNASGYRTLLGSISYFSLSPQARKTIELAVGYGRSSDTSSVIGKNIAEMKMILNHAGYFWDTLSTPQATLATNDTCNTITSIEKVTINKSGLNLYPNPASTILQINVKEPIDEIQIFDMKGALVKTIQPRSIIATINVSDLNDGIYFLKVLTTEGMESEKFMIVR